MYQVMYAENPLPVGILSLTMEASRFVVREFSEAAALYGDVLEQPLTPFQRCAALCNRAAAYAAMDLNRKVLADADAALAIDSNCVRALLLKGEALHSLGRDSAAVEAWTDPAREARPSALSTGVAAIAWFASGVALTLGAIAARGCWLARQHGAQHPRRDRDHVEEY